MKLLKILLLLYLFKGFAGQTLLLDQHFSPYCGSGAILFSENLLMQGEDYLFRRASKSDSTLKVWGRFAELLLFWNTLNGWASVEQHEYFGHGYRLRDLGFAPKKYVVTPWFGATYFNENTYPTLPLKDLLATSIAGLEAEEILATELKKDWITQGAIDGRIATLYQHAWQSAFWYTLISKLKQAPKNEISGNDINNYILLNRHLYPNNRLTHKKLLHLSLLNWLDPMTFYSYYSFFYYIAEKKPLPIPMLSLGKCVRYLPNIKMTYAPYFPEMYLENFFIYKSNPLYFYLKGGKKSIGFGIHFDAPCTSKRGTLGFRLHGWKQSLSHSQLTVKDFLNETAVDPTFSDHKKWGMAFSLIGKWKAFDRYSLFAEFGGKTAGYLPGHTLKRGIVARLGLSFGMCHLNKTRIQLPKKEAL